MDNPHSSNMQKQATILHQMTSIYMNLNWLSSKDFFSSQNKLTTRMTGKKIFHNLILLHRDTQEYWLNQKFDWLFLSRLEIYVQSSQNILFHHFISSIKPIKPTLLFHIEGTAERWENRSPICHICQQIKSLNLKWVFSVAILSRPHKILYVRSADLMLSKHIFGQLYNYIMYSCGNK